jgi:hypothetical protein
MALWAFVECGRCGYSGCAAPIGDACPRCNSQLAPEPPPPAKDPPAPNAD